jgi:competence protein ComEA
MKRLLYTFVSCAAFAAAIVAHAGPVNVNTADAETLAAELTGVGPALARAIVEDRERNGLFSSAEDLTRVNGIGMRVIENNREFILVETQR